MHSFLAIGAAWLLRPVDHPQRTPAGMDVAGVLTLHLTPRATAREYLDLERAVAALPGIS